MWELYLKCQSGKLKLSQAPPRWLTAQLAAWGVTDWAIDLESLQTMLGLPVYHGDPFDRMLVAQPKVHAMTVISPDPWIRR